MGRKYPKMYEGEDGWTEWVEPLMDGYKLCCCDCGLVHVLQFRIASGGEVEFRAQRDNRATGQIRRHYHKGGK